METASSPKGSRHLSESSASRTSFSLLRGQVSLQLLFLKASLYLLAGGEQGHRSPSRCSYQEQEGTMEMCFFFFQHSLPSLQSFLTTQPAVSLLLRSVPCGCSLRCFLGSSRLGRWLLRPTVFPTTGINPRSKASPLLLADLQDHESIKPLPH